MTFSLADQWRRSIVARLPAKLVGAWLSLTILVPTLFSQGLTAPLGAGVFLGVQGLGLALAFLAHPGLDVYLFLTTRSRLLRLARIELGQPLCAHCEYPMTAMQDAVECPECGHVFCAACDGLIHGTLHACPGCCLGARGRSKRVRAEDEVPG